MIRLSLHKFSSSLGHYVVAHVKSNLPEDYIEQLQIYLEGGMDPDCSFYDPDFPWDSAEVVVLYLGLKAEADEWVIRLPDGREARVFNINPGATNRMAGVLKDYAAATDVGRAVLLSGGTARDAAWRVGVFCRENLNRPEFIYDPERAAKLLEEMEEYRRILEEDAHSMDIGHRNVWL